MSRRSTRTNEHDVAVAECEVAKIRIAVRGKVWIALIAAVTVGTVWSINLTHNTVVYAPGGTVAVTSDEVSADAGTLPAPERP